MVSYHDPCKPQRSAAYQSLKLIMEKIIVTESNAECGIQILDFMRSLLLVVINSSKFIIISETVIKAIHFEHLERTRIRSRPLLIRVCRPDGNLVDYNQVDARIASLLEEAIFFEIKARCFRLCRDILVGNEDILVNYEIK